MPYLRPFEDRSADHLRLVLETSQTGIWELDVKSGLATRNETHDRIFGYDGLREEWSYEQFLHHVVEKDRDRVDSLQRSAIENNEEWSFDCQIRTATGKFRWIKATGRPLHDENGEVTRLIGHVIDITDAKQNEARLQIITEELNHRVRNMLAIIKSMVKITAKGATDIDAFAATLEGRVGALARTHNLLVSYASASMMPSAILKAELEAFQGIDDQVRLTVNGEAKLGASAGQGLALVIHELITNALKYGSLSNDSGRVEVTVDRAEGTVDIVWRERGGPAPVEARREGFGSMLICQALGADGTAEQIFSPEGLECRVALTIR